MYKFEVTKLLGARYRYKTYLEITTTLTGMTFPCVDRAQFRDPRRALYNCPEEFSDGYPIHLRRNSGADLFKQLEKEGTQYDVVFLDPWHTYQDSIRDIALGLKLVKDGGVMVVHDCNPPETSSVSPEYKCGEWSGVTYAAYVDFVLDLAGISYVTVDCDYGCGIIVKDDRLVKASTAVKDPELERTWYSLPLEEKRPFFLAHQTQLLRLISPDQFDHRVLGSAT